MRTPDPRVITFGYLLPTRDAVMLGRPEAGPDGLREWLDPYLAAGARHVVLRVADEQAERGLEAAALARELSGLASSGAPEAIPQP